MIFCVLLGTYFSLIAGVPYMDKLKLFAKVSYARNNTNWNLSPSVGNLHGIHNL